MSDVQKEGEYNISLVKTTHKGIVCKKCGMNPIVGYRYKCSICKDYNLCERCEEKNYETQEHLHDFIKMRNEEKVEPIPKPYIKPLPNPIPVSTEYKYELVEKNPETFYKKITEESKENVKFEFSIINKSKVAFPLGGKTKLIMDKTKTKINIGDIAIEPEVGLKPDNIAKISLLIERKDLKKGDNKIIFFLNVDGKNIGSPITLNVGVKNKAVEDFRNTFNLNEKDYDDGRLLSLLQKYKFNFEQAFSSLFNN